jgi:hypothetical protein
MKVGHIILFWLVAMGIALTSCGPVLYNSVGQNVPLFREKGEAQVAGGVSLSMSENGLAYNSSSGVVVQGALAATNRVALISSFNYFSGDSYDEWSHDSFYFEVGAGIYKPLEDSKAILELLGGIGSGFMNNQSSGAPDFVKATYIKPFVQPSFGWRFRVVELAITPRIALVNYVQHSSSMFNSDIESDINNFFATRKSSVVFEPGLTFRAGGKIKFQYQFNYTTFNFRSTITDPVENIFMSFGIWANVGKK